MRGSAKKSSYDRNENIRVDNRAKLRKFGIFSEPNNRIKSDIIGIIPGAKGFKVTTNLRMFSLAELRSATRGFSRDMLLGDGNYGRVFIGWLDEDTLAPSSIGLGMAVSIKRLNPKERFRFTQVFIYLFILFFFSVFYFQISR